MPAKKITRRAVKVAAKKTTQKKSESVDAGSYKITKHSKPREVAELDVERKKISDLKPHPRNPRNHPKPGSEGWEVLKKSLEHDYFDPMVWNKRNGMLVSGHLRRKVFQSMGIKEADVVIVDYDEPTHLARLLAANKSIGEDDSIKLTELIGELGEVNEFDFSLAGFTMEEVNVLTIYEDDEEGSPAATEGKAEIDPRLQALVNKIKPPKHKVNLGESWRMGKHYLFCASVLTGAQVWSPTLASQIKLHGKKVVFVACPDPYVALTDKDYILILVQPDPYVAGHIMSLYRKTFPAAKCSLIS